MALLHLFLAFLLTFVATGQNAAGSARGGRARPELLIQSGHTGPFTALAVGTAGRVIATADGRRGDGTIKLWQGVAGLQVRTLVAHAGGVLALAISPDDRRLASSHSDDTIRIWDIASGRELRRFYVPNDGAGGLEFTSDGRHLLSLPEVSLPGAGRDREPDDHLKPCPNVVGKPGFCNSRQISMWDVDRGVFAYDATPAFDFRKENADSWFTAISPDNRLLVTSVGAKPADVRALATGRKLASFSGAIGPFVFSPDSRWLAARTVDGRVGIWNVVSRRRSAITAPTPGIPEAFAANGREIVTVFDRYRSDGLVTAWNVSTGADVRRLTLPRELECANCGVHVSRDGQWIVRGGYGQPRVVLWNFLHPERAPKLWNDLTGPLVFSPKVDRLFAAYFDRVWSVALDSSVESCSPLRKLSAVRALMVSGSPAWLATSQQDVVAWDANTGAPTRVAPSSVQESAALSVFGRGSSVSSAESGVTWIPGVSSGPQPAPRFVFQPPDCAIAPPTEAVGGVENWGSIRYDHLRAALPFPVAVSPAGNLVENDGPNARLRNIDQSVPVEITDLARPSGNSPNQVTALTYTRDGGQLAVAVSSLDDALITVLDGTTLKRQAVLTGHTAKIVSLAYRPTGRTELASSGWDQTLRLWDTTTGRQIVSWPLPDVPRSIMFSPNGGRIALAMGDEIVEYDMTGTILRRYVGHSASISGLAYAEDGALIFSGSDDGTTRVWDAKTGAALATLITVPGSEDWLVVAPDGLFDGSPGGWSQLLWRFNHNTFDVAPLETFYREFYQPGLLAKILAGERPKAATDIASIDRRLPDVGIALGRAFAAGGDVSTRLGSVTVTVREAPADRDHPRGSGVRDLRLFRNGSEIKVWHGDIALDASGRATRTLDNIPLVAGDNHFSAYAFNRADIKSRDADALVTGAATLARRGVAWILAIGIDHYRPPGASLSAAAFDARDFSAEFAAAQQKLGRYDTRVISLPDDKRAATKANIMLALDILSGKRAAPDEAWPSLKELRRAEPEDAVVVFFAGHGTANGARFYLLPADVEFIASPDAPDEFRKMVTESISDEDLSRAIEGIDSRDIILVIDACRSGQVIEADDPRQGPMNSSGLAQLAYEKGLYVLAASQAYQDAAEAPDANGTRPHGLLTQALLDAITKGPADPAAGRARHAQPMSIREWLDDAVTMVPQLYRAAQRAVGRPVVQEQVQRPRVFYRRFPERLPFLVAPGSGS